MDKVWWGDTFGQCPHHFKACENSYPNIEINELHTSALKSKKRTELGHQVRIR